MDLSSRKTGAFFVIDGTDGSGKATQTKRLVERLRLEGYNVETISFPQYGAKSCGSVERYLAGDYGRSTEVNARAASIFYAVDRFDASFQIRAWLDAGKIVVSDRYVGSNMAHQGQKIHDTTERHAYLAWNDDLEHNIFGIPRPTLNLVLSVPLDVAIQLAAQGATEKTKVAGDIHEADRNHIRSSINTYKEITRLFPSFHHVNCAPHGTLRSIDDIHEELWQAVLPHIGTPVTSFTQHQETISV
ncbi:thymidylate kinase [Candidatus Uhrbacteria bacterium CG10_big_fil_rev_8_21_14_0_10_50_16]|uniref:Thymidylate kinase n=1 Tax=Candidatus Uhrbacteria bacterium CG10_big_fil_rev_8_21_14_0_10_50_16 TaxID=1975039 RepID=A0A2H0RMG4_9BACT|nr:MAG: thymidylate kinase [Candidatus Uhrbacteria bacterium CG10_big_fil_rev_8_21_14_0_10_50_16]